MWTKDYSTTMKYKRADSSGWQELPASGGELGAYLFRVLRRRSIVSGYTWNVATLVQTG
jgi:hypothetical protein